MTASPFEDLSDCYEAMIDWPKRLARRSTNNREESRTVVRKAVDSGKITDTLAPEHDNDTQSQFMAFPRRLCPERMRGRGTCDPNPPARPVRRCQPRVEKSRR